MNPFGKYRSLRDNAVSALMAAIEIYNKPRIEYRNESFVILIANAWELYLKAILSRNRTRIFYPKERDKPYLTLSLTDALDSAKSLFPDHIDFRGVAANLNAINDYRNNAIHFYNEPGMDVLLYGLGQTAIVNFRDVGIHFFDRDIADEINLCLMPLSFGTPPDPITFIKESATSPNAFLSAYIRLISETTHDLEAAKVDTGRFLTVFSVSLQSTKKIQSADIVAGVQNESPTGILLVERKLDPNLTHPNRRKDVLDSIGKYLHGVKFNQHTFEVLAWQYGIKENSQYCWKLKHGGVTQYSNELVVFLKRLARSDVEHALAAYKKRKTSA
jgi:hypothetical protein